MNTESYLCSFSVGTGNSIITTCDPILKSTQHELILATCFWARSTSQQYVCDLLQHLSSKALARAPHCFEKIRVRLCFSSSSLSQKLVHTSSAEGQIYDPSTWQKKLCLPHPDSLRGLDLQVKSVFVKPLSVMHPKYIVVDRRVCVMPSCNISWERWFEGCVVMQGPVVDQLLRLWQSFWCHGYPLFWLPEGEEALAGGQNEEAASPLLDPETSESHTSNSGLPQSSLVEKHASITLLDHPHERNPRFRPFPCQAPPGPRMTSLNDYTVTLLTRRASSQVWITTPNLTSPPVLAALRSALTRGVHVRITTNRCLMRLEQLATAGTTTPRCVRKLILWHKRKRSQTVSDPESGLVASLGALDVSYFKPRDGARTGDEIEPDHLHLKMMVVDDGMLLLGSGNQDRASWYTSQEVGIALEDYETVKSVKALVEENLHSRLSVVCCLK